MQGLLADVSFFYIFIGIIIIAGGIGVAIAMAQDSYGQNKKNTYLDKHSLEEIDSISIGTYIAGFDDLHTEIDDINLSVSKEGFNFFTLNGKSIGRIDINSITNIMLEDKSSVHQRLTATRILALGVFSLAAPKKKKNEEYCIIFEWEDSNAENQNAVFEFKGFASKELSSEAHQRVKKYIPLKNRKCPFCAETIKRAAKVCKHCGKDINHK